MSIKELPPPKFKVGDIVVVKNVKEGSHYLYPISGKREMHFAYEMKRNIGEKIMVRKVEACKYGYIYRLKGNASQWAWTEEFLEHAYINNKEAKGMLSHEY